MRIIGVFLSVLLLGCTVKRFEMYCYSHNDQIGNMEMHCMSKDVLEKKKKEYEKSRRGSGT